MVTAGTLVADDGETPCGSIFVIDAKDRAAVDAFIRSDPYHVNGVWGASDPRLQQEARHADRVAARLASIPSLINRGVGRTRLSAKLQKRRRNGARHKISYSRSAISPSHRQYEMKNGAACGQRRLSFSE